MDFLLKNIEVSFEKVKALKNINLKIPSGKIFAIIGPSGSGKTTILRILNLLDKPSKGKIFIDGYNPTYETNEGLLTLSRKMVMVFQNPFILRRSVLANVMYGGNLRGLDKSTCKKKSIKALYDVGLKNRLNQYAPTLSAGESQRMALARALVIQPQTIFLDEYTANLDPGNVELLEKLIYHYNKETGGTVILSTHNLYQAKRISHHTAVLFGGEIIEEDYTVEIFKNPKNNLTKRFLSGEIAW